MSQNENPQALFPGLKSNGDGTVSICRPAPYGAQLVAKYSDEVQAMIDELRTTIEQMQKAIVDECKIRGYGVLATIQVLHDNKDLNAAKGLLIKLHERSIPTYTLSQAK